MNKIQTGIGKVVLAVILLLHMGCGTSSSTGSTGAVTADAGGDQDVLVGAEVTLDGLSSVGVTSSTWSFTSTPTGSSAALASASSLQTTFTADVAGDYVVQLSVNSATSTDSVTVTAKAAVAEISVPAASAITTRERFGVTEYIVDLEATGASLSAETSEVGTGSSISTYSWEQIGGPTATITSADTTSATLEFTAPSLAGFQNNPDKFKWQLLPVSRDDRKMMFRVTIDDGSGNTDAAVVDVYLADAGAEIHTSSGLPSVGVQEGVYLSGPISSPYTGGANAGVISDWSWTLSVPTGSSAVFADTGTTSSSLQFPYFIPDVSGLYTVSYSSTAPSSSSVATTSGTISISAANYVGVGTVGGTTAVSPQCANCHDGTVESDLTTPYEGTVHASVFENNISNYASLSPEPYKWEFHTVGYNADANNNDGFDDLAAEAGFEFPSTGMTFSDFVSEQASVAVLANVQCESCHGPGSAHKGSPTRMFNSDSQFGVCGQCHQQESAWLKGGHNFADASHQTSWLGATCARCHASNGFKQYVDLLDEGETELVAGEEIQAVTETGAHMGVTCAACHDPHDATNPAQLRRYGEIIQVVDGSTVDAGKSAVCYTCHDGFYNYGHVECDSDDSGTADEECLTIDQVATEYNRQVHYNSQSAVFEGKGALNDLDGDGTEDFTLDENSFHSSDSFIMASVTGDLTQSTTNDKCITCHMSTGPASTEEGYNQVGGHNFEMRSLTDSTITLSSACQQCHDDVEDGSFDRPSRGDFDGDGTIEGIESEVKGLLYLLTVAIQTGADAADISSAATSGTKDNGDGTYTVKTLSYTTTGTGAAQTDNPGTKTNGWYFTSDATRREVYNYNLIAKGDKSWGVHNAAYIVQVLQGTLDFMGVDTSDMDLR